mmetsp:Transcript_51664/g.134872  ORF Transcript_51664/g.134872 Transcript_51664/m.134872 type:complete len:304 (-) Transcript_51664:26-937(-)
MGRPGQLRINAPALSPTGSPSPAPTQGSRHRTRSSPTPLKLSSACAPLPRRTRAWLQSPDWATQIWLQWPGCYTRLALLAWERHTHYGFHRQVPPRALLAFLARSCRAARPGCARHRVWAASPRRGHARPSKIGPESRERPRRRRRALAEALSLRLGGCSGWDILPQPPPSDPFAPRARLPRPQSLKLVCPAAPFPRGLPGSGRAPAVPMWTGQDAGSADTGLTGGRAPGQARFGTVPLWSTRLFGLKKDPAKTPRSGTRRRGLRGDSNSIKPDCPASSTGGARDREYGFGLQVWNAIVLLRQ